MRASPETVSAIRFGYGLRSGDAAPATPDALIAQVIRGTRQARETSGSSLNERMADVATLRKLRRQARNGQTDPADVRAAVRRLNSRFTADRVQRIRRAVLTEQAFYERLVWFWADHFTVSATNRRAEATVPVFEAEAIRPHVAGRFAVLLRHAVTHPAMLYYLDQTTSVGPSSKAGLAGARGLNENLAREILELHTLGVEGQYGQHDVRQFAELLTGLGVRKATGASVFRRDAAEPGTEVVLGRSYGGGRATRADIHTALDDLAAHPATSRHLATKLAVHFVSDAPPADLVDALDVAYRRSDGDLLEVYGALLDHPESWSSFGAKVKQPFDYVVSSLRTFDPEHPGDFAGLLGDRKAPAVAALARMNQPVYRPPGPDGWAEDTRSWITPQGLAARVEWSSQVGRALASQTEPGNFVSRALAEVASEETRFAATHAAERWEGIALALASPEFNRR